MFDPFTAGAAGVAAVGKLLGGAAQSKQDRADAELSLIQANLYGLNAETAKTNVRLLSTQAEIAEMGEQTAYARARLQKGRISEQGEATLSAQRAEFANRNIDPAFGSPLVTQAITAGRIAQDLELTDAGAAIEAADAKTRGAVLRGQAAGAQGQVVSSIGQQLTATLKARSLFSKANDDMLAGYIGAASSLLSGGAALGTAGAFSGVSVFQGNPFGAQNYLVPTAGRDF